MNCPEQQTILAFADGEIEAVQAAEVERHLTSCPNCSQFLAEMQWVSDCGRAALRAIPAGETASAEVVWPRNPWRNWARPAPLAVAAMLLLALSTWKWFAPNDLDFHQVPRRFAFDKPILAGAGGQSGESAEAAFEQWAAPYRQLHVPLVPMEVAASYNPDPIEPILPDHIEGNNL
jgi:anti-sigma factor RsiW